MFIENADQDLVIPASPTAGSVNERLKAIDDKLPTANYLTGTAAEAGSGYSTHSAAQAGTDAASKVLATPAQLLKTDVSGKAALGNMVVKHLQPDAVSDD